MSYFKRESYIIEGKNFPDAWVKACQILNNQDEIIAGENYKDNTPPMTKDAKILFVFYEKAIKQIIEGDLHPSYRLKGKALEDYANEMTYTFVKSQNSKPKEEQFDYNYFDLLTNTPLPDSSFLYQGNPRVCDVRKYKTPQNGFDQIKWLHDAIREDGISRRHKINTWFAPYHCFDENPPCLQSIWTQVLVPKSEYKNYDKIPVEVQIDYRSWDIPGAFPSNIYALIKMLNRYVFGNLTEENDMADNENVIDYEIKHLTCNGSSCHAYYWDYDLIDGIRMVR